MMSVCVCVSNKIRTQKFIRVVSSLHNLRVYLTRLVFFCLKVAGPYHHVV